MGAMDGIGVEDRNGRNARGGTFQLEQRKRNGHQHFNRGRGRRIGAEGHEWSNERRGTFQVKQRKKKNKGRIMRAGGRKIGQKEE